jgi:hypothetical protein
LESGAGSPVNVIPPILAVAILAQAMDGMVSFAVQLANKIATNSFFGFDLGGVAGAMQSYTSDVAQSTVKTALGIKEDDDDKKGKDDKENPGDKNKNNSDTVKRQ